MDHLKGGISPRWYEQKSRGGVGTKNGFGGKRHSDEAGDRAGNRGLGIRGTRHSEWAEGQEDERTVGLDKGVGGVRDLAKRTLGKATQKIGGGGGGLKITTKPQGPL